MSEASPHLLPLATPEEPDAQDGGEREHRGGSAWPVTLGAATGMTAILGLALAGPGLANHMNSTLWPALLLPGLLTTLAGRLVFEAVEGATRAHTNRRHLLSAAAGALTGACLMAAATAVLGLASTTIVTLLPAALAWIALIAAGLVRDLEIRVRLAQRRVFFVGAADGLRELRRELIRSRVATLVGTVTPMPNASPERLSSLIRASGATVLVIDRQAAEAPSIVTAARSLGGQSPRIRDLMGYYESEFRKVPLTELTPAWFLFEHPAHQGDAPAAAMRRAVVATTAGVLLLTSLPMIALLTALIRLTSPGPAIFRQVRVGKDGVRFTLFKLRTMTVSDDLGEWATDQAHRVTPLGRILRRYRLDELPQLWNVLRGELALVGPRPEQVPIVERLERQIPFYGARHAVRPGLTGWAQVNLGYSGSLEGARAKLQRDLYYVKHRSLRLDLLILWLTLRAVFTDPR